MADERPMPAIKELIGIDYIYRCGYLMCNKTIKSIWDYCPYCGSKIDWGNCIEVKDFKKG